MIAQELAPLGVRFERWIAQGENPDFTCIRLFDSPQGWVANFTGSDIANKFSCLAT